MDLSKIFDESRLSELGTKDRLFLEDCVGRSAAYIYQNFKVAVIENTLKALGIDYLPEATAEEKAALLVEGRQINRVTFPADFPRTNGQAENTDESKRLWLNRHQGAGWDPNGETE